MISIVYELMGQKLWLSLRDATLSSPERIQEYADQHWAIYKAIESRDPDRAYDRMNTHLETVEQFMVDSDMVPERVDGA